MNNLTTQNIINTRRLLKESDRRINIHRSAQTAKIQTEVNRHRPNYKIVQEKLQFNLRKAINCTII